MHSLQFCVVHVRCVCCVASYAASQVATNADRQWNAFVKKFIAQMLISIVTTGKFSVRSFLLVRVFFLPTTHAHEIRNRTLSNSLCWSETKKIYLCLSSMLWPAHVHIISKVIKPHPTSIRKCTATPLVVLRKCNKIEIAAKVKL